MPTGLRGWSADELEQAYIAGNDLIAMGRWHEAVRVARAILREDPNTWRSAVNAGGLMIEAAPEIARRDLLRAAVMRIESELANVPEEFKQVAHYNLGNGYLALGQKERGKGPATRPSISQAITHLDEALSIGAEPNIRINLANALSSQGRTVEALVEYNQIIKQHPEWHEARSNRALALEKAFNCIQPHRGLIEVAVTDMRCALGLAAGDSVRERQYRSKIGRAHV